MTFHSQKRTMCCRLAIGERGAVGVGLIPIDPGSMSDPHPVVLPAVYFLRTPGVPSEQIFGHSRNNLDIPETIRANSLLSTNPAPFLSCVCVRVQQPLISAPASYHQMRTACGRRL